MKVLPSRTRLAAVLLGAAAASGCGLETVQNRYDTYALAESNGAFQAGWLPKWLPRNATNIREVHNIDTNEVAWAAEVPVGQELSLPADCLAVRRTDLASTRFKTSWWPEPQEWGAPEPGAGFYYFTCSDQTVGLAAQGGMLFGWSSAK